MTNAVFDRPLQPIESDLLDDQHRNVAAGLQMSKKLSVRHSGADVAFCSLWMDILAAEVFIQGNPNFFRIVDEIDRNIGFFNRNGVIVYIANALK